MADVSIARTTEGIEPNPSLPDLKDSFILIDLYLRD